uniref:Uncharacterized protein n=1 Tax=Rhizophora mucronata TaxID=61149 RepID=A0A2P2ISL6_RHIMU
MIIQLLHLTSYYSFAFLHTSQQVPKNCQVSNLLSWSHIQCQNALKRHLTPKDPDLIGQIQGKRLYPRSHSNKVHENQ